jgi:hypothetical protein
LWQTDLFTFVLKRQNRRVYLVAFLDDHSRFVVGYGLHASQSSALVLEVLRAALASYGAPTEILTDNGSQYVTGRGKSAFTKELEQRGIRQVVARPDAGRGVGSAAAPAASRARGLRRRRPATRSRRTPGRRTGRGRGTGPLRASRAPPESAAASTRGERSSFHHEEVNSSTDLRSKSGNHLAKGTVIFLVKITMPFSRPLFSPHGSNPRKAPDR